MIEARYLAIDPDYAPALGQAGASDEIPFIQASVRHDGLGENEVRADGSAGDPVFLQVIGQAVNFGRG